jgi:Amt family ammonium transporter
MTTRWTCFGVHCIGGIVGAILTGCALMSADGRRRSGEGMTLRRNQLWIQCKGVLFTVVYSGILSFVILKIVDVVIGLRVTEEQETEGLDLALHDERGYSL